MDSPEAMECPFCGFQTTTEYQIILHIEELHTSDSPFVIDDGESLALALTLQRQEGDLFVQSQNNQSSRSSALSSRHEPSVVEQGNPVDDFFPYVECPHTDCDEFIHLSDYNEHLDLHASANPSLGAESSPTITNGMVNHGSIRKFNELSSLPSRREHTQSPQRSSVDEDTLTRTVALRPNNSSRNQRKSNDRVRLGRSELGPFAWEERMPSWLINQLQQGATRHINKIGTDGRLYRQTIVDNETSGIVPVLARLCVRSESLQNAYLCHPCVQYVFKRKNEGGFCGYRNIQMFASYLLDTKATGHERLGARIPGIIQIQELVEDAWSQGIGPLARQETGGILYTRKWIGTPEAAAFCGNLGLNVSSQVYSVKDKTPAHEHLLDFVENYFRTGLNGTEPDAVVRNTSFAPIYLQHSAHSLTIVGFERHKNGDRNLLVFDPAFEPSRGMGRLVEGPPNLRVSNTDAKNILGIYRRGANRLRRYSAFETLSMRDVSL